MKLLYFSNNQRLNNLASKIADQDFKDLNLNVGILVSKTKDVVGFPRDRFGRNQTLAVTIPKDGYKEHEAAFPDISEIKNLKDKSWDFIIFLGTKVLEETDKKIKDIITHELQHVKQEYLKPVILAKDRLVDIVLELSKEKINAPSEINAKAKESLEEPIDLWVKETSQLFKKNKRLINDIHWVINFGYTKEQLKLIVPPEIADLFEFFYKKFFPVKILIFVEGTILMHSSAKGLSREDIVKQSKAAGIQREERNIAYDSGTKPAPVPKDSVYDLSNYIPIGKANQKLKVWADQGAEIVYLSSRRIKSELDTIQSVLKKYNFPQTENFYFRQQGEDYKDVAERLSLNILIEDDCKSIGGENEMTYTHIKPELKQKIKHIVIKEFGGIDHLPDNINELE